MAVTYFQVLADVMSQMNGLQSRTVSEMEQSYGDVAQGVVAPGYKTSTDWSIDQMKQAILDAEYELCSEICFNTKHPERGAFLKFSNALFHLDPIPALAADSTPFLGEIDTVKQTTTNKLMSPRSQQTVEWAVQNENSLYSSPDRPLVYCITGGQILHNASSPATVILTRPALARGTFGATAIQCSDYHKQALVAGALTKILTKEGAYADAFNLNAGMWSAHIERIRSVGAQIAEATPSQY